MSSLIIRLHQQTTLAIDPTDGKVNASLLVKRFGGRSPAAFLLLEDAQPLLASVAERNGHTLPVQWLDNQLRNSRRPDFMLALTAAGFIRQVAGTVDGHSKAAHNTAGNGVRNYAPGLWVHRDIAAGLARWAECRGEYWKPSPLAEFVEQVLAELSHQGQEQPQEALVNLTTPSAADLLAGTLSAATLQNLRAMDQILISGGLSLDERLQTLKARLALQPARAEG